MEHIVNNFKNTLTYIKIFLKWIVIACAVGTIGGVIGSSFHISVDYVTELRTENSWIIYLLPVGAILITAMYSLFKSKGPIDTNRVLNAVAGQEKIPFIMLPLIFISTVVTHLVGGSAGREGAALQLGGSIGYNVGRTLKLDENDTHLIVMAGMSSVFAALFGTPITAAVFSLEVTRVGKMHYTGFLPCVMASITAFLISQAFGIPAVRFDNIAISGLSALAVIKVIGLAVLCAVVSMLFCTAIKKCEGLSEKFISNNYLRAIIGAVIILLLTLILKTRDYNGAGMDIIAKALSGEARYEAFILKIVFTAITISAGFKGGEIVPTFFIGATFGCVAGQLLGLDASFGAAIGLTALFCGVVNCPLASVLLATEMFGGEGVLFFALACAVSYMMSGYFGLYKSQKIIYSKLYDTEI